jgi:DNA polymerase-1
MGRPLVWILDAHYQIFRAYHALPDLRAPDGTPTGAVRGYAASLLRLLERQQPTHLAAAFDFALTSFRNQLDARYKLGRTEAPPDLEPQFALCAELTAALGIAVYELADYEADDVIAALVRRLLEQDADAVLVSADKDLGALVGERVRLFDPRRETLAGPAEVRARLGVPPECVADFLALVGDPVDHVPGVPGIGARTAAALLARWGSIDAIPRDPELLAGAGVRSPAAVARSLERAGEQLALSRELVRLRDDLPLKVELDALRWRGADRPRLTALLERLGAQTLLARVPRWAP